MERPKPKSRTYVKATALVSFLILGMTVGIVFMGQFQDVIIEQVIHQQRNHWIAVAEGNPGAGKTGFLVAVFIPHNVTMPHWKNNNDSHWNKTFDGTWTNYSWSGALNTSAQKTIPYGQKFDIYFKVRVNVSDGQNTTSKWWNPNWQRANITCAALGLSNQPMKVWNISATKGGTGQGYIWCSYFVNGTAGNWGYQISKGQKINISLFQLQIYK
jgi:hypothetical protein